MKNKTVITQNSPHKVSVPEGSSHASRRSKKQEQGGDPKVIETLTERHAVPVIEEVDRALHAFDTAADEGSVGDVDFGRQEPFVLAKQTKETPTDPERALLDDWTLSAELIERIDELRTHNTRISNQIDQLTAPSKKARV
jgi:hypothetical protein